MRIENLEYDGLLAPIQTTQLNNNWEVITELANYFDEKGEDHKLFNVFLYNAEVGHVEESSKHAAKNEADEAHKNLVKKAPQLIKKFNNK
ncbi:hypothetical protein PCV68_000985 [Staphylococcus pseudintermedius]|nr:hypothetical protein [Staphylococcus pseudintermedius]